MPLKIASINIERSKHLPRIEAFLNTHQPDVLCLQELCERDIPFFEKHMGAPLHYAPMTLHAAEDELQPIGVGLVARTPLQDVAEHYYVGNRTAIPAIAFEIAAGDPHQKIAVPGTINSVLVAATVQGLRIATTHLNVTPRGESTPLQLAEAAAMVALARQEAGRAGGLLLCGDFNAPRGRATFNLIAESFIDGIPAHYNTSIDGALHRAGPIPYMVDGLFHTPTYALQDATLHPGVSDHMALTTTLSRTISQ